MKEPESLEEQAAEFTWQEILQLSADERRKYGIVLLEDIRKEEEVT